MISIHEEFILQAQRQFDALLALVEAAQGQRIDCVEGDVFAGLLGLGLTLIRQFVASKGTGDAGPSLDTASGTWKRLENLHPRRYVSIFGELTIDRTVYGTREKQKLQAVPLEEKQRGRSSLFFDNRKNIELGPLFRCSTEWCKTTAEKLGLQATLRPTGRPRKEATSENEPDTLL